MPPRLGLAYWPAKDWLTTSLSVDTWLPGRNMLAVKNRSTGALVFVQYSSGAEIRGHMGGVSVAGGSLLLSTSSGDRDLFRFSLRALELAPHNTALKTNGSFAVKASSYNTAAGDYLYVGTFSDGTGAARHRGHGISRGPDVAMWMVRWTWFRATLLRCKLPRAAGAPSQ